MTSWEYLQIETYIDYEKHKPFQVMIKELRAKRLYSPEFPMSEVITSLGMDGWELVSFQILQHPTKDIREEFFMFKRPLSEND